MNNPKTVRRTRGRQQHKNGSQNGRRVVDSNNRVDQRSRGNPIQLLEKYKSLARDATTAGDRILAENYFQHADHYQRLVNERQQNQPHQRHNQEHQRTYHDRGNDHDDALDDRERAEDMSDQAEPQINGNGPVEAVAVPAEVAEAAEGGDGMATTAEDIAAAKPRRRRRTPRPKPDQEAASQEPDSANGA